MIRFSKSCYNFCLVQVRIGKISFFVGRLIWFFRAWAMGTGACAGLVGVATRGGGGGESPGKARQMTTQRKAVNECRRFALNDLFQI